MREIDTLPGPRGIPVLGNMLQVRPANIHRDVELTVGRVDITHEDL